jgi:hypothetical protein
VTGALGARCAAVYKGSQQHVPLGQIHETIDQGSLAEVSGKFDWSALKLYTLNEAGKNHGVLLGTKRWKP